MVNIEASRLPTKILPRIFYLLINSGIPHPFFRYVLTYLPLSRVGPCIRPIQHTATKRTTSCPPERTTNSETKKSKNFVLTNYIEQVTKMAPTGIVSSNEISSTTGLYEVSNNKIPKISSNDLSSNMVSSTTGTTYSNKISNTKVLGYTAAEISSNQVSSTSGKS